MQAAHQNKIKTKDLQINNEAKRKMDPANIVEHIGWAAPEKEKSNWESQIFTVKETVAPGAEIAFQFKYNGEKKIKTTKASCGCTSTKTDDNNITGKVAVAKDFSFSKEMLVPNTKTIQVTYEDNTTDILTIKYTVDKSKDLV